MNEPIAQEEHRAAYPDDWSMMPDIYDGIPETVYHADRTAASKTWLDHAHRSGKHLKYYLDHGLETTPAMRIGSALHCAILEPDEFNSRYLVAPKFDLRTKAGKAACVRFVSDILSVEVEYTDIGAAWQNYVEQHSPTTFLTVDDYDHCRRMCDAVWEHDMALALLEQADAFEQTFVDAYGGIYRKCRIDLRRSDMAADLKTTRDASPDAWPRTVANFRYHVQAAWYIDVAAGAGLEVNDWLFMCVENTPPYGCAVYRLHSDAIELGREQYMKDAARVAWGIRHGRWDGYPDGVLDTDVPAWAYRQI